ncbi:unnamed protein product [Sphenostylis stenocarpa]|uniref:MMS19 nucleotide excision repair protein n=1 Tax=Sphenostylis stenocarpa TaxID=92480 RepID=A0AA86VDH6_9FABA|nr:unnamed protein product [Sphenostylis stenocarpa]
MAEITQLTRHIESYIDTSSSDEDASLNAIVSLVKTDVLPLRALVTKLEMYLTATDDDIRGRGILLLAEVITRIESKPLDSATIHILVGFFKDRLADWRAVRGALVGCLALIRRKSVLGIVTSSDAKAIAQSFFQYMQVQSLGQYDRKLCFELLDCLLEHYSDMVTTLGDDLIYGICASIDAEMDPECLMLAFHVVESLARLYPDSSGPLASFAKDVFDILEPYFPLRITHPNNGDTHEQRDNLSRSLMIESLKYLTVCSSKYGAERIAKYAKSIWSSIKDTLLKCLGESDFSLNIAPVDGIGFPENEFEMEALSLLQQLIVQNSSLIVSLIIEDDDVNIIFNTIASYEIYDAIPVPEKKKLHAIGRILYITSKTTITSCNAVFESFFSRMMDNLGSSFNNIDSFPNGDTSPSQRVKFGFLYLCIELLAGFRELIVGSEEPELLYAIEHETCCTMLHSFSSSLFNAFGSVLAASADRCPLDPDICIGVKGLQILAMFHSDVFSIQQSIFENILKKLMSIIIEDFNNKILWEAALKALYHIGSFVHKFHESEKAVCYRSLVAEKIVELLFLDDHPVPFSFKVEALSNIGMTGIKNMLTCLQGLRGAVFANLSKVCVRMTHENGGLEDFAVQFVVDIWSQAENCIVFDTLLKEKGLLDALMKAMKLSVGSCSVENQNLIIQKAYSILSSHSNFQLKEVERVLLSPEKYDISLRDEGLISLFASVVIAVCPKTLIPNLRVLVHLFRVVLLRGIVPVAQALGSILNKLVSTSNSAENSSDLTLEEALDIIFDTKIWFSSTDMWQQCNGTSNGKEVTLTDICLGFANDKLLQINVICGLSWIGKGLLLRGHEKIKDITMTFIECLIGTNTALPLMKDSLENTEEQIQDTLVMKSAADAFHVLMSDCEVCLNRKFHATIQPLYKQRFFSSMMPIFLQLITKAYYPLSRSFLYRAFAHILSDTPMVAVLSDAKKLIPVLLDCLSVLTEDIQDKDMLYGLLLVLSGILTDKYGQDAVIENAHIIINCLIKLVDYPHKMLVRETALQCLVALSELPHARVYPMRTQVLRAISKCLDDTKRSVRHEAVKCRQTWASMSSRSLHF